MRKPLKKLTLLTMLLCMLITSVCFGSERIDLNNNDDVFVLQFNLNELGYNVAMDGFFGEETKNAITNFQYANGLNPTGELDSETERRIIRENLPNRAIRSLNVRATGYTRYDEGCSSYTSTGAYLQRGIIAVDPDVIPIGTRLYIPGYGQAVAADVGGAIEGNVIDLAFDSVDEAYEWGNRYVTIYVMP